MSQFQEGNYYVVNGVKYDSRFPEEWATNHLSFVVGEDDIAPSGPEDCGNCACYGSIRGVFVGYCSNCAKEYKYERGGGFDHDFTEEEMWENLPYMKGVKLNRVGVLYFPEDEEPECRKRASKQVKTQVKKKAQVKKGAQRKIRRALRMRRVQGEYVGIPEMPMNKLIEIRVIVLFICISILAAMSFYLV
jgi:hypothetical protein